MSRARCRKPKVVNIALLRLQGVRFRLQLSEDLAPICIYRIIVAYVALMNLLGRYSKDIDIEDLKKKMQQANRFYR